MKFFLKFQLFHLATEEIQSTKMQNNIYFFFWIFLPHFLLNFFIHKIKKRWFLINSVVHYPIFWHNLKDFEFKIQQKTEWKQITQMMIKNINPIIFTHFFSLFCHIYLNVNVEFRMHFGNRPNKNIFCNFFVR